MDPRTPPLGALLRTWRARRRLSQMELAHAAGVSPRHLSFVETGRARPSREMVLHLAEHLEVPLRERNALLLAAGFAPAFPETDLADPGLAPVREALDRVLAAHEPFPAVLVDRRWEVVAANRAAGVLLEGVAPELLEPPVNVLRVTFHPDGMAGRIANLGEWADHTLGRLRREALVSGDAELAALDDELRALVATRGVVPSAPPEGPVLPAVPLRLRAGDGELAFVATIATFGTALDITLAELALEAFLPADDATLRHLTAR